MKVAAIVPAAGLGLRFNRQAGIPKPLVKIAGKPIFIHTLFVLSRIKSIKRIILAVNGEYLDKFRRALERFPVKKRIDLVIGGASRSESVENCLKTIDNSANTILVHDAARPFVSKDLIERLLKAAKESPAVISGVPVKATIKSVKVSKCQSVKKEYMVEKTLNRDNLWEIQTPQVFSRALLLKAYKKYRKRAVMALAIGKAKPLPCRLTDDASLVEKLGVKVKVVRGSYFNIKITTPEDLVFAKTIAKSLRNEKVSV